MESLEVARSSEATAQAHLYFGSRASLHLFCRYGNLQSHFSKSPFLQSSRSVWRNRHIHAGKGIYVTTVERLRCLYCGLYIMLSFFHRKDYLYDRVLSKIMGFMTNCIVPSCLPSDYIYSTATPFTIMQDQLSHN